MNAEILCIREDYVMSNYFYLMLLNGLLVLNFKVQRNCVISGKISTSV